MLRMRVKSQSYLDLVENRYEPMFNMRVALPTLLTGLASGVIGGLAEKAISKGSGLYLGKRGRGVSQIHMVEGGGLYLSPLFYPEEDYDGLYVTNDGEMYKGSGLILGKDSPFRNIPILGWLL